MKARTLLKKLTDSGLTVTIAGDNIRLSPISLVTSNILNFTRLHKDNLIFALHEDGKEDHIRRKCELREGRLDILRLILWRYLHHPKLNKAEVESHIDAALKTHNYDLEATIEEYVYLSPCPAIKPLTCVICGYRPAFCNCTRSTL